GILVVALSVTFEARMWALDPWVSQALQDGMVIGFLLWVLVVVLREVFRSRTREVDAVVGALCGFLLILMVFMRVHGLIEALRPDSYRTDGPPFSERSEAMLVASFQYFSTITLTTVGFGDIVPVTPAARLATGLEAMVGQLYLAVVIATLVGRVAARRACRPPPTPRPGRRCSRQRRRWRSAPAISPARSRPRRAECSRAT